VGAAGVPFRIEGYLQVGQGDTHFETDTGVTGQVESDGTVRRDVRAERAWRIL
jgi:hypothetical protein